MEVTCCCSSALHQQNLLQPFPLLCCSNGPKQNLKPQCLCSDGIRQPDGLPAVISAGPSCFGLEFLYPGLLGDAGRPGRTPAYPRPPAVLQLSEYAVWLLLNTLL